MTEQSLKSAVLREYLESKILNRKKNIKYNELNDLLIVIQKL